MKARKLFEDGAWRGLGSPAGPEGLIAAALGDVREQYVWRFFAAQKIDPADCKFCYESDDPMWWPSTWRRPRTQITICVNENWVQALKRAQGYLKLPEEGPGPERSQP